jgi:Lrp/AsnC family leucine-responsive transcriptional regulator
MKSKRSNGNGDRRGRTPASRIRLDEVDIKVLTHLVRDSRISQRALAREIGMSAPGVADRIARLEKAGVITGYRAQLDWAALGRTMTVVVGVLSDRSTTQLELAERLAEIPEVERIDVLTGANDLQLRIRVRDQAHLNYVLFDRLMKASSEIQRTDTQLALITIEPEEFSERVLQSLLDEMEIDEGEDDT